MGPRGKDDEEYIGSDGRPHDDWKEAVRTEGVIEEASGERDCRDDSIFEEEGGEK